MQKSEAKQQKQATAGKQIRENELFCPGDLCHQTELDTLSQLHNSSIALNANFR